MKRSRFTDSQILAVPKQADALLSSHSHTHLEALQLVQPMHFVPAYLPALSS